GLRPKPRQAGLYALERNFRPEVSPRVALLKEITPAISAYASVSTGFLAAHGGGNPAIERRHQHRLAGRARHQLRSRPARQARARAAHVRRGRV
ncbi:MAG: hypothetical protein WKG07_24605, partial [Hymenobacter sp.]